MTTQVGIEFSGCSVQNYSTMAPAPEAASSVSRSIEDEISQLHERLAVELHRYALSIARVHQIACDAVQGVFLRYFVERRYGREIGDPRVWLYQAIRNELSERIPTRPAAPDTPRKKSKKKAATAKNPPTATARSRNPVHRSSPAWDILCN